jgi:ABC-type phosphate transport system substrate-binding protein
MQRNLSAAPISRSLFVSTRNMKLFLASIVVLVSTVFGQDDCAPDGSQITLAGSTTVEPIARSWAAGYVAKCPNVNVTVEGGGSSIGARRVCNRTDAGSAVDIGNMSREWNVPSEVNVTGPFKYICNQGTKTRTVTQVEVAIDGLTIVLVNGGLVAQCLRKLPGRGFTIDQLRWIYSNYTQAQLIASGWKATALNNSDGNDATHKWSELSSTCPSVEIKLASPGALSGTFTFFKETVLPNATEGEAKNRPTPLFESEDDKLLVNYVATSSEELYGDAITYFGYAYYKENGQIFYGVPIQPKAGGAYVNPNVTNVESGAYTPFSRRIYMNFWDGALTVTGSFLSYGFNPPGIARLRTVGYVPPTRAEILEGLTNVGRQPPVPTSPPVKPPTLPPVPPPGTAPTGDSSCGLLGLSLFCPFTFCGLLGKALGLCSN